jgi:hypothetical protein
MRAKSYEGRLSVDSKLLNKIKSEFISGKKTLQEAADEYNVPYSTLTKKSHEGKWKELRKECGKKTEKKVLEATAERNARDIERFYNIGNKLLDKAETMIDNIIDADDFVKCSNAMSKIKDVLDLRSKEDRDEQRARIEKLRKEAERDDGKKEMPDFVITGLPEEFKR